MNSLLASIAAVVLTRPPVAEPNPTPRKEEEEITFFRYARPLDWSNPRYEDSSGKTISSSRLRKFHEGNDDLPDCSLKGYNFGPKGGVTFYFHWKPVTRDLTFSFSMCWETEHFVKREGRDRCMNNYVDGRHYSVKNVHSGTAMAINVYYAVCQFVYGVTWDPDEVFPNGYPQLVFKSPPTKEEEKYFITLKHWMEKCLQDQDLAREEMDEDKDEDGDGDGDGDGSNEA